MLVASFSFAHSFFYVSAALAVVLGFLAHRTIRQYPDMFTGQGLANAGIALGLIFGLTSATYAFVQTYVRTHQAEKYAKQYAETLKSSPVADALLQTIHPEVRKDQNGDSILKKLESSSPRDRMSMEQKYGQLIALKKRLDTSKEEHVNFVRIEGVGDDEGNGSEIPIYAAALYEVDGPGSKEFPEKQQYAMAILKGRLKGRQYEWWVDDVRFPYKPKSYEPPAAKPVDDGHGHAH